MTSSFPKCSLFLNMFQHAEPMWETSLQFSGGRSSKFTSNFKQKHTPVSCPVHPRQGLRVLLLRSCKNSIYSMLQNIPSTKNYVTAQVKGPVSTLHGAGLSGHTCGRTVPRWSVSLVKSLTWLAESIESLANQDNDIHALFPHTKHALSFHQGIPELP